jgi:hypothetical protein
MNCIEGTSICTSRNCDAPYDRLVLPNVRPGGRNSGSSDAARVPPLSKRSISGIQESRSHRRRQFFRRKARKLGPIPGMDQLGEDDVNQIDRPPNWADIVSGDSPEEPPSHSQSFGSNHFDLRPAQGQTTVAPLSVPLPKKMAPASGRGRPLCLAQCEPIAAWFIC